ncbi:MAG: hypothetical protein CVU51_13655 [Deltaproteobacteria bacterium HGW-Deltaproteobacteria-1]|nr:MAG: hypothetical protein CVU51_13655 [Deltaproteobacteria bacterium HGW-Deltaproteobacteria-1]
MLKLLLFDLKYFFFSIYYLHYFKMTGVTIQKIFDFLLYFFILYFLMYRYDFTALKSGSNISRTDSGQKSCVRFFLSWYTFLDCWRDLPIIILQSNIFFKLKHFLPLHRKYYYTGK